jgi:hypothetical protein
LLFFLILESCLFFSFSLSLSYCYGNKVFSFFLSGIRGDCVLKDYLWNSPFPFWAKMPAPWGVGRQAGGGNAFLVGILSLFHTVPAPKPVIAKAQVCIALKAVLNPSAPHG